MIENNIKQECTVHMLTSLAEENKIAFITCIEIVLMRRGNPKYNSVIAKIRAQYDCEMSECVDHPEYLKTTIKEVYKHEYDAVLDEISVETERLVDLDKFKADFLNL